jgi:hypothetical protein
LDFVIVLFLKSPHQSVAGEAINLFG